MFGALYVLSSILGFGWSALSGEDWPPMVIKLNGE
jgi:hypothetical protein